MIRGMSSISVTVRSGSRVSSVGCVVGGPGSVMPEGVAASVF